MLCLKKRRTYSFTQGTCASEHTRRNVNVAGIRKIKEAEDHLSRKISKREERSSAMVLTVTEDTPADMLAGSMDLLVQMPREHHLQTQRVTVQRSTPMMDLLVQIATAHKLAASSYTLQAIGERGLILAHQPNTPIGALDVLQVKLLPKQGTLLSRKTRQANQPFETTFRLQVHLPRNQLYVSRVSPKTNLGEILDEVCREKNLDQNKYELRHPGNLDQLLDLSLSLQDYHLQEVTLFPKRQSRSLTSALSSQDIMELQKQEECHRHQSKQHNFFGFMFNKNKASSLSTDSFDNHTSSPARSNSPTKSIEPQLNKFAVPSRPHRKRRPAPKPPVQQQPANQSNQSNQSNQVNNKDKVVISHSRNSSDSSGYHEASILSDNPESAASRMPETLPRRGRMQGILESPRQLAHTAHASKSLGNLPIILSGGATLSRGISNTSICSAGQRKKRAAPPPPKARTLPSAISHQGLERITDSDESLTSDMDLSKPSSDIIDIRSKASSDITPASNCNKMEILKNDAKNTINKQIEPVETSLDSARVVKREAPPVPKKTHNIALNSLDSVDAPLACTTPYRSSDTDIDPNKYLTNNNEVISLCEEEINLVVESMISLANEQEEKEKDKLSREQIDFIAEPECSKNNSIKEDKIEATDTDILLQKVSDTLSNSLTLPPPSPPPSPEDSGVEIPSFSSDSLKNNSESLDVVSNLKKISVHEIPESKISKEQEIHHQVTSSNSSSESTNNGITSDYVSSNSEDLSINDWDYQIPAPPSAFRDDDTLVSSNSAENLEISKFKVEQSPEIDSTVDCLDTCTKPRNFVFKKTPDIDSKNLTNELKKDVISELETKIESRGGRLINEPIICKGEAQIAPIDNTLSNFTITTYTKPKSLDIFEQIEQQQIDNPVVPNFETSAKCKTDFKYKRDDKKSLKSEVTNSMDATEKSVHCGSKILENHTKEKKSVYRSKSYIASSSNEKFQNKVNENHKAKECHTLDRNGVINENLSKKCLSISNINESQNSEVSSTKEKFSQWRDNILRKQEETSPEMQLQSLKVLKTILPQIRSAQEKMSNNIPSHNSNFPIRQNTEPEISEAVTSTTKSEVQLRNGDVNRRRTAEPSKRYTYNGPPSISLGSWSERPSINVQIKTDTDYKLSNKNSSLSGPRTIVNLNVPTSESKAAEQNNEPKVDTTSVKFSELAKTFGKMDIKLRDSSNCNSLRTDGNIDFSKQNGSVDSIASSIKKFTFEKKNENRAPVRRFTSVTGIGGDYENEVKVNESLIKQFSGVIKEDKQKTNVPKPPTMPVITGVTLKSVNARPKRIQSQVDPRDQLLESIRNFGQGNLKKVAKPH